MMLVVVSTVTWPSVDEDEQCSISSGRPTCHCDIINVSAVE